MWKAIKKFIQKLNQTPVNEEENEPVELVFKKEISVDELSLIHI